MFDQAFVYFSNKSQINSNTNSFSVDGGEEIPLSGGKVSYRVPVGAHTVTVNSGSGSQWTIQRELQKRELLTIKLDVLEGEIFDVLYRVERAPLGVCLQARKLPKSHTK